MCNKIEELEKKIADLEKTNDLLRTLVKKKDARIKELHEDYDELNDISIELTQDCNELESECKDLKRELDVTKELSYERGEIVEAHQDLKDALKTVLNFIYGVDTDGDKIENLKRENESLRKTNIDLVNRFGGETDCIIRTMMTNGGKI